jgi:geranylgeranyl diphosphate synthase, type II
MQSFEELSRSFLLRFDRNHFPPEPASLYKPADYFLGVGGKRVRPVLCLMGNELFDEIHNEAYHAATAIELFHNFTLIHDDIMDNAPLRRGMQTVHEKYGTPTALLTGDVMLIVAYNYLNQIGSGSKEKIIHVFNKTAMEVCEGQQIDMDYEKRELVSMDEYFRMIELKTSVLLAASLQIGAIIGGAGESNQHHLYQFGRNLGLAFQLQDDFLDAFGDPIKFGKQVGGDIIANKKTFLLIKALEIATESESMRIRELMHSNKESKVQEMLAIFKKSKIDKWAMELKEEYINAAYQHLDDIAVLSVRKKPLIEMAQFLVRRDY